MTAYIQRFSHDIFGMRGSNLGGESSEIIPEIMAKNSRDVDSSEDRTQGNILTTFKSIKLHHIGERECYFILLQGKRQELKVSMSDTKSNCLQLSTNTINFLVRY